MTSSERGESIHSEPANYIRQPRSDWIDRVRAADADAESAWVIADEWGEDGTPKMITAYALIAIAAELRAQRIARRPGAGRS